MQKIGFCDKYSLTQAVLNGTKTMTRRIIPQKVVEYALNVYRQDYYSAALDYLNDKECLEGWLIVEKKSRYKLGEVVAVEQSYKILADQSLHDGFIGDHIDYQIHFSNHKGWSNKLFVSADLMPNQIQITDIKIEHLQDITDEDCLREGIRLFTTGIPQCKTQVVGSLDYIPPYGFDDYHHKHFCNFDTPREAFAALIDRPGVGHKGLWEENPWVVVYEFKKVK